MLRRFTALKEKSIGSYNKRKKMWNKMTKDRRAVVRLNILRSVASADPQELRAAMNSMS